LGWYTEEIIVTYVEYERYGLKGYGVRVRVDLLYFHLLSLCLSNTWEKKENLENTKEAVEEFKKEYQ